MTTIDEDNRRKAHDDYDENCRDEGSNKSSMIVDEWTNKSMIVVTRVKQLQQTNKLTTVAHASFEQIIDEWIDDQIGRMNMENLK